MREDRAVRSFPCDLAAESDDRWVAGLVVRQAQRYLASDFDRLSSRFWPMIKAANVKVDGPPLK